MVKIIILPAVLHVRAFDLSL